MKFKKYTALFTVFISAGIAITIISPKALAQQTLSCPEQQKLLTQAVEGLQYQSESDYPLSYFRFANVLKLPLPQTFANLTRQFNQPVTQITFDEFFQKVTRIYPGMSQSQFLTARRFKVLESTLRGNYQQLTVYRVGTVEVYIYIAGVNSCGLTGLQTVGIET
ncbi:nuclease A inhibitor family protein [Merismopedia glauca]|uniref:Uncharacterized protein n=1 Tax=Merismopedia glauca CCAP 1448/3 TaxID=1296344 RepID=A0A2T1BY83_9CYAN|nr:nuclease A inhibitor family protein [Merismopedia glauca]PSB00833.1 hypothetical protein C7B64_21410 [Merismopedia glauca CCAP 1448/3]